MKKLLFLVALIAIFGMTSCTDANQAKLGSYGKSHKIEMYSGGKKVREWISTGKVSSESNSDGYYFFDRKTGKLIEVSGDVVITRL